MGKSFTDNKSDTLTAVFFSIVVISTVVTFYRYILLENITFLTEEELFQESLLEE